MQLKTMAIKTALYFIIFAFLVLLAFSTFHQAGVILEKVKLRGTLTEYHDVDLYPPTTIVVAAFQEFEMVVSRHNGQSRERQEPRLLQNCSVFAIPYLRSQNSSEWIPLTRIQRVEALWASYMFFEGPADWRNGYLIRVVCMNPRTLISYLTYVTPKNYSAFYEEWELGSAIADYNGGLGAEGGSYSTLFDQSGIIPIMVSSGTLTSIELTRKETLLNEQLQSVEIATKVSSTVFREAFLTRLMTISYRYPDGHILRVKNFQSESYYSLAILFCTVALALERSYAFMTRIKSFSLVSQNSDQQCMKKKDTEATPSGFVATNPTFFDERYLNHYH